jgi:hypothetical protein
MSRSLYDQDTQIHKSGTYDDTIAPSVTNWETNPTSLEDDMNALRSAISLHLDDQAGDWYDDLNTPATLDAGSQRGINVLNTDLHANERKRILRRRQVVGADVVVPSAVLATESLVSTGVFTTAETVTIGTTVYALVSPFVDIAYNVDASGSQAQTHENLRRAINDDGVAGTNYGTGTVAHPDVTATDTGTTTPITAKVAGTAANLIATTTTCVNAAWGGLTMSGGAGDMVILDGGAGELPGNLIAAVGAVTTLGTVVASVAGAFDQAALTEVTGGDSLTPKNLCKIADSATGEIIVDGVGNEIHALLQSEFAVDGTTITVTTADRVQLSFVVHNATNDDLILVDGQYIAGQTIDYAPIERYAFEDIPEHAWLSDTDFVDAGSGAVDREEVYNNQGTTPVDVVNNATLDLEGPGLVWSIRDDLEAILFRVIEGSAGGTSEVEIDTAVDVFDVNAITTDFANEIKVDTGGTEIDIGVTGGTIETTGSADLRIDGAGELLFIDGNEDVTWSRDGILLSDTSAEWIAFEAAFGEVSLLNAIVQAVGAVTRSKDVAAVITADIAADVNVTGGAGANISAQLGDYSGVTFVDDVDVFVNGQLQWNGANAGANNDVYPGDDTSEGDLKFEYILKYRGGVSPDVVSMIVWG